MNRNYAWNFRWEKSVLIWYVLYGHEFMTRRPYDTGIFSTASTCTAPFAFIYCRHLHLHNVCFTHFRICFNDCKQADRTLCISFNLNVCFGHFGRWPFCNLITFSSGYGSGYYSLNLCGNYGFNFHLHGNVFDIINCFMECWMDGRWRIWKLNWMEKYVWKNIWSFKMMIFHIECNERGKPTHHMLWCAFQHQQLDKINN